MNSQQKYQRISNRLPNYDYSKEGLYFITLCVENGVNLFGDIYDGELQLNSFGQIAKVEWLKTEQIRNNVALHEFIIMPNHFHAIVEIIFSKNDNEFDQFNQFKSPSQSIGAIVRGYKGSTTKKIKEIINNNDCKEVLDFSFSKIDLSKSIWQRNFHDHIIRNQKVYIKIAEYIRNNPFTWKDDRYYKN